MDLISTRRELRRARRNRKTRYRKPRFDNRVHNKKEGWLAPSVEVKIQEHITVIKRICNILPVSNVRQYVLWRDGYICQHCGARTGKKKEVKLQIHDEQQNWRRCS